LWHEAARGEGTEALGAAGLTGGASCAEA